jgi:hypothetical protein
MVGFGSTRGKMMGRLAADIVKQVPQQAQAGSNMIQQDMSGASGLAASAAESAVQPTLSSGVNNSIPNSNMFGNRTNGSGMFGMKYQNGLAAMANQQQNPNINNIMNGAQLI